MLKTFKINTELYFTDGDSYSKFLKKSFKKDAGSKIMKHFKGMRTDVSGASIDIIAPVQIMCDGVFFIKAENEEEAKEKFAKEIKSKYKQNYSVKSLAFDDFAIVSCVPLEEKIVKISECRVYYFVIDAGTPVRSAEIAKRNFMMQIYGSSFRDCGYHFGYDSAHCTVDETIPENMKPHVGLILDEVSPKEFRLDEDAVFYNELREFYEINNINPLEPEDHPFYPVRGWWKDKGGFRIKVTLELSKIVRIYSSNIDSHMEKLKKNAWRVLIGTDFRLPVEKEEFKPIGELENASVRVLSEPVKEMCE